MDWIKQMRENLVLPAEAKYQPYEEHSNSLSYGDLIRITEILEEDEHYGILCEIRKGRRKFVVPMAELEINDRKHPNYKLVEEYNTYFSNR